MTGVFGEDRSLFRVIEKVCEKYPHKPGIIYLGENFTFSKLADLVRRFSCALSDLGVRKDDKVMIYMANCPQLIVAYFAIQEIGATPVLVSPIYTPFELEYMLNDSGADTVICQDTNFHYAKEVSEKAKLKRIIVTNLVDLLPRWKQTIGRIFDKIPKGVVKKDKEVFLFKELIRRRPGPLSKVTIHPDEHLASILYTGGTTGVPKRVLNTHTKMLSTLKDLKDWTEEKIPDGGKDVLLMAIPLFPMMGQEAFLGWGLGKGISVVLMPVPQIDAILEAIQMYQVTTCVGVPALYRMILGNERINSYDLRSLKYCWCGGDVLPSDVFKRWHETFHIPLYQIYGTTETGCVALSSLDSFPVMGSIGSPVPSKEIKVVDPDTLKELPSNQVGELLVSSKFETKDDCSKPEKNSNDFVELDGKRWNITKDFILIDDNQLLFYVDRSADIIKYKGYRISCSEIEAVLQDFQAVKEACVIGVPDPAVGELIKAIVVLKENTRGVGASELTKWCREKLAPYKIPDHIEFRDTLPKSKVGKLLRREIREEERRRWLKNK